MATIDDLRQTLDEIRQQLLERPAFFKGSGAPVDDPAYDKEIAIFESLQAKLSLTIKELQLAARNARGKGGRAKTRSRKQTDDLLAEAQRLQASLKRVMQANDSLNPIEGAANLWNNQHEYHEANLATHTEVPANSYYSDVHHAAHKDFAGTLESTALFVFTALQAYVLWMKRRKKKSGR
jgi:hypothetical protein